MRWLTIAFAALLASPALAEVKSATPSGFEVARTVIVAATPAQVYAELGHIGDWWSDAHSYSGDAKRMTLDLRPGGCFCETLDGGGAVEHMRVVYAQPDRMLRLSGGLGPLQAEAVAGALTWSLKAMPGGTEISQTYVVGGFVRGGADKLAPLVDQVLGEQLARLKTHLETPAK